MSEPTVAEGDESGPTGGSRHAAALSVGVLAAPQNAPHLQLIPSVDPLALVGLLFIALAVVTVYSAVEIVEAYEKEALTVFGEFRRLLEPGIHFIPPFVSRTYAFDMRTQTMDVPQQEAITRDNSPVTADAVVYIRVMDAERAFLEVEEYKRAVSNLAQTTLRAVLGDMELDDTLSRREMINARIREELDEPTDEWGIRVESVEVREVTPARGVKDAMEQQTSAERRRRAMILESQGERRSAIERAEGEKQSDIVRAQGKKQSQILEAQGDAVSTVLRARSAESMGERAIIDKGMETLEGIGQGESTTFVLPQELSSMLGRYGKHLSGSDVTEMADQNGEGTLESLEFDEETSTFLGLDDVAGMAGDIEETQIDVEEMEQEAQAIKEGEEIGAGGGADVEAGTRASESDDGDGGDERVEDRE
jgi:regulator of protease activity HflC (stomatin/prohibitin superfamily)